MKNKKIEYQEAGKCPKCGSDNLDYLDYDQETNVSQSYDIFCNDCKTEGKEFYTLTYDETIIV